MMAIKQKEAPSASQQGLGKTKAKDAKKGLRKKLLQALKHGDVPEELRAVAMQKLGGGPPKSNGTKPAGKRKRKREEEEEEQDEDAVSQPPPGAAKEGRKKKTPKTTLDPRQGKKAKKPHPQADEEDADAEPKAKKPHPQADEEDADAEPKAKKAKLKGILKNKADTPLMAEDENLSKRQRKMKSLLEKKIRPEHLSKKERRALRLLRRKDGDLVQRLLRMWEELRAGSCSKERRSELVEAILDASRGRVAQLVLSHDTSRVFETVLKLGSEAQRLRVLEEVGEKDTVRELLRSKFGKFVLLKMLMHGARRHKERVFVAMDGLAAKLLVHRQGAFVLNSAYNDYATAAQRSAILQELFGPPFSIFKSPGVARLRDAFAASPGTSRENVLASVKALLLKAIAKGNVNYMLVHTLLLDFLDNCSDADRAEVAQALREHIVALLHTREGVKAAMAVLWHSSSKERKALLRSMKTFFANTAVDEHGYLFVLAVLDSVDDIVLLAKLVLKELFEALEELVASQYGRKVLLYMLARRSPVHFHPQLLDILRKGDDNPFTKKPADVRDRELRERALPPLLALAERRLPTFCNPNAALLLLRELLVAGADAGAGAAPVGGLVAGVARLLRDGDPVCADGESLVESAAAHMALKKALQQSAALGRALADELGNGSLTELVCSNRGCFLLVTLCETADGVGERLARALKEDAQLLASQTTVGANILRKKLKL